MQPVTCVSVDWWISLHERILCRRCSRVCANPPERMWLMKHNFLMCLHTDFSPRSVAFHCVTKTFDNPPWAAGPVSSRITQSCHQWHNYISLTTSSAHCHINSCSSFSVKQTHSECLSSLGHLMISLLPRNISHPYHLQSNFHSQEDSLCAVAVYVSR